MLTSVANYLFGGAESEPEAKEVNLKTQDGDEGWELVDYSDTAASVANGFPTVVACVTQDSYPNSHCSSPSCPSTPASLSPQCRYRSTLRNLVGPTESWIVTPPPCFTAGGKSTSVLETNPLENLLIEHPSMSVYNHNSMQRSDGEESNSSDSESECIQGSHIQNLSIRQSARRSRAITARAAIMSQVEKLRISQRVHHYVNSRCYNKNNLRRVNKTKDSFHRPKYNRRNQPNSIRTTASFQRTH